LDQQAAHPGEGRGGVAAYLQGDENLRGHDRDGYVKKVSFSKRIGKVAAVNEKLVDRHDGLAAP
jgi:hypothetical protein